MTDLALAFDLGTGGCKASLWTADASMLADVTVPYATSHPAPGRQEQRPADWWDAVVSSTRRLLEPRPEAAASIVGIALSGQSLGVVQVDERGELVAESTPIWSDARGITEHVFSRVAERDWYRRTGNGFGAPLYPLFKVATLARENPSGWSRTRALLGSKDWVNLRLTGVTATDHSMASGSGAYALADGDYDDELLDAGGLDRSLLPRPVESAEQIGRLSSDAATALGLPDGIPVFAGAVDNAAMALGSRGTAEGRIYAALGSSSWITVTSAAPVLDDEARPYVFRHVIPGLHVSALSTFSSGTTLAWLRDLLAPGEQDMGRFIDLAAQSEPGARGVVLVPTLAGGTPLEGGPDVRGVITGLSLGTGAPDLVRACLEGIAFALRRGLDRMRDLSGSDDELLISGGGSRSSTWNRIYADVLGTSLLRTSVDQQAAALGAAAIAFVGAGVWSSFTTADDAHTVLERIDPDPRDVERSRASRARFDTALAAAAATADSKGNP